MLKLKQMLDITMKFLTSKFAMVLTMNTSFTQTIAEVETVTNGK